ncbi:MAG: GNAT family N-acetyltransferase, partial [bacterium]|nr:GNAT family N-acetyltransferase [bacterium]
MTTKFRKSNDSDISFLKDMLYEAVFWRTIARADAPLLEVGLALPEVSKALADWGKRDGDTAIISYVDSTLAGAAWFRYWTDDDSIRGHIEESIPTLVLAVHKDFRRCGIGKKLIEKLIEQAVDKSIYKISLMVSKDNYALD